MPKRKRRSWVRLTAAPRNIRITISSSGSTCYVPPPAKPIPLGEAVALNPDWARDWHGDRAVARFLWERYKAAKGPRYSRAAAFKVVGKQMGMSATSVKNLLNRSARESAKRNNFG